MDIEPDFVARLIRERELELDAGVSALLDWPWRLRVYALGTFRVAKGGSSITFAGKAQRRPLEMLKVVVANGGREVSEERVIGALWPRIDGDSAHRSFTVTLHRLRKLLGEERAIQLSDGKLSLDGRLIWVDIWAFEQLVARIGRALRPSLDDSPTDRSELAHLAAQLAEHYAGPFLDTEPELGWVLPMRDRLRQRFVRTVIDVARHWLVCGTPDQALDLLERAVDLDHSGESIYRCLMECYASLGRRAEAVDTYVRCRKMLAATVQTAPSAETTALYERLIQAA
jgi:DNA-binding SARP family transcriptional activator